jgi:hypothetical protein
MLFHAVMHVLDQDAKDAAGGLTPPVKKKKRHHQRSLGENEQVETGITAAPIQAQPQISAEEEMPT